MVTVAHVRAKVPAKWTAVYVGRAMPGLEGSPLGNPLPVVGRRWTDEAERWTRWLAEHEDPRVREAAGRALTARGYAQGEAATLYREVLREQCRRATPQREEVLRLARLVQAGERLALQCWCAPRPCHAAVVRDAVLGYAGRKVRDVG